MKNTTKTTVRNTRSAKGTDTSNTSSASGDTSTVTVGERITSAIVAALQAGVKPWIRPWKGACASTGNTGPYNAVTGKAYRGINVLLLGAAAYGAAGDTSQAGDGIYADPRWLTYCQAQDLVKKSGIVDATSQTCDGDGRAPRFLKDGQQRTTEIVFWSYSEKKTTDADGKERKRNVPFLRSYRVFNVEQTNLVELGLLTAFVPVVVPELQRLASAEALIQGYADRPEIREGAGGDRAYYIPALDKVHMPKPEAFMRDGQSDQENAEGWYATLFHELAHSTGAASRLNRTFGERFGDDLYAEEELVAEIAAAMMVAHSGLTPNLDRNAGYVGSWLKALQDDPKMIEKAARAAQKAVDHMLGVAPVESATAEE